MNLLFLFPYLVFLCSASASEEDKELKSKLYKVSQKKNSIFLDPLDEYGHEYTLIFVHGLGDSASGMFSLFSDDYVVPPTCRIVLPSAPKKAVECADGMKMRSWFNIKRCDGDVASSVEEIYENHS